MLVLLDFTKKRCRVQDLTAPVKRDLPEMATGLCKIVI